MLLVVAVLLIAVMIWAVPRSVQPGDAGEFATIMLDGGVPHPSGYPWMRILGFPARLFHAMGVPPATAAALPCAAAGCLAWLLLHPILVRIAGAGVATFVVALLGTASVVVVHTCDSEVWGPHLLMSSIVLRVALSKRQCSPLVLGLVLGLAVSHHLTAVLLVPLAVGAAWPSREPQDRWLVPLVSAGAKGIAGSALGLTAMATLAIGSGGHWRWGDTGTLSGLIHHISRADYGVLQLSLHQEAVTVTDQWVRTAGSLGSALTAGFTAAPLAGLVLTFGICGFACWRRPAALARGPWWGLMVTALATVVGFPALHNIDPTRVFGAWILERFDLLSLLVLSIPLAVALGPVSGWASDARRKTLLALLATALVGQQVYNTGRRGVASSDTFVEHYAVALLRTPTPGVRSVVFGTDDHRTFPVLYAQVVLGEGPDVLYIDASLLSHSWYRRMLRRSWPSLPDVDKPVRLMGAIWQSPDLAQTPIYLANNFSRPSANLNRVPEGVLWRIVPPPSLATAPPPLPAEIVELHRAALGRLRPMDGPPSLSAAHPFTGDLAAHYNEPTRRLITSLMATGHTDLAQALADDLPPQ